MGLAYGVLTLIFGHSDPWTLGLTVLIGTTATALLVLHAPAYRLHAVA
jgi:F0F1-type ATP synthase assembly protein I